MEFWGEALPHFESALELDPENLDARAGRGRIRGHCGNFVGAMVDFNEVLRSEPNHVQALLGRGTVQLERDKALKDEGLYKAALGDFNKAQIYGSNDIDIGEAHAGSAWALYA
jgi:tetratricopeptide (TPR) repeat protein